MKNKKRKINERKFKNWKPNKIDGRIYWYDVKGRFGWSARYTKEVDSNEETIKFLQEILMKTVN